MENLVIEQFRKKNEEKGSRSSDLECFACKAEIRESVGCDLFGQISVELAAFAQHCAYDCPKNCQDKTKRKAQVYHCCVN